MTSLESPALGRRRALVLFAALAAAMCLAYGVALPMVKARTGEAVPEWVPAIDLLIVLPLAYLAICRPPRRRAPLAMLMVASLSVRRADRPGSAV